MSTPAFRFRIAAPDDAPALVNIYAPYVEQTAISFEYDVPSVDEFRRRIVRYFTDEYLAARTPVPCTLCNNLLKWPLLAQMADGMGIPYIATGHYVRKVCREGKFYLAPAADPDKDQSFFLWGLKQDILRRMLLPMGDLTKAEARAYAARRGFGRVAEKKDSLGVCFCPGDYRAFLWRELPASALPGRGRFLDEKGDFLGWHEGYPFYTVGQRRGLGIHLNRAVYVKEIRRERNEVVLAPLASLYRTKMLLKNWNLVDEARVTGGAEVIVEGDRVIRLGSSGALSGCRQPMEVCFVSICWSRSKPLPRGRQLPFTMPRGCCWAGGLLYRRIGTAGH